MSDFRCYSHELLSEFIDCFQNHPCLWQIKHNDYKNKSKKLQAYSQLLEIIRKVEKNATIDSVKKKINSLRAGFRKENKKVLESKRTGSGVDQIYVPKLWYFSQLQFLTDQNEGTESFDSMDSGALETNEEQLSSMSTADNIDADNSETEAETADNLVSPGTSTQNSTQRRRRKRQSDDELVNTISMIGKKLQKDEDEYDAVGKNVAVKLRNMNTQQQGIAEKLINEILFLGRFEKLNFNATINIGSSQEPIINLSVPPTTSTSNYSVPAVQDSEIITIPDSLVQYLNFK